jgi:hypothetical protein
VLPATLIERGFRKAQASEDAICGYFHPYDVDLVSQRHQDFARWHPFDVLLRVNRGAVIPRLERVMRLGLRIVPYREHVADLTHVPGNVDD